jgi:hypothetical protein
MASTVNVMILHVNWQTVNCALGMVPVSVGNVIVMQTGLVRPVIVHFLQTAVEPVKGVKSALVTVTAAVALAIVMIYVQEYTVKMGSNL